MFHQPYQLMMKHNQDDEEESSVQRQSMVYENFVSSRNTAPWTPLFFRDTQSTLLVFVRDDNIGLVLSD